MSISKNCLIKIITNDNMISDYVDCATLDSIYNLKERQSITVTISNILYIITYYKSRYNRYDKRDALKTKLYTVKNATNMDSNVLYEFNIEHKPTLIITNKLGVKQYVNLTLSDVDKIYQLSGGNYYKINDDFIITLNYTKDNKYKIFNELYEEIGTANIIYI